MDSVEVEGGVCRCTLPFAAASLSARERAWNRHSDTEVGHHRVESDQCERKRCAYPDESRCNTLGLPWPVVYLGKHSH